MLPQTINSRQDDCIIDMPTACQDDIIISKQKPFAESHRCPSQSSSLSSNSGDICRICHCEGAPDSPLITPCYCSGSLRYVHQSCLQQWIKSSNIRNCELCKFQFIMQTKVKPFNEWEYLEMSGLERKKLLCAMLFHIIAMTCVCWSLYVLIDRTLDEVQKGHLEWPFWTKLIVVGIGFMGGIVFMYIQCKAYFILCKRWKAYNRVIYVQNAPEKPSLHPGGGKLAGPSEKDTSGPSCSSFKSYSESSRNKLADTGVQETNCIDIKGVRNLHIFFGEENQIRLHRNDRISENKLPTQKETYHKGEEMVGNAKSEKSSHMYGNTSLHIQIGGGNMASDKLCNKGSMVNADGTAYGGALCPSDLKANRKQENDNKCGGGAVDPSSVVKLQIKKAEIVIEFGENPDGVKYSDAGARDKSAGAQPHKRRIQSFTNRADDTWNGIEIVNSPRRKFSSEEYLDCEKYTEKVANESNELPTSRLLISKDKVPLSFKEKAPLKDWRSSEDLGVHKVSNIML